MTLYRRWPSEYDTALIDRGEPDDYALPPSQDEHEAIEREINADIDQMYAHNRHLFVAASTDLSPVDADAHYSTPAEEGLEDTPPY